MEAFQEIGEFGVPIRARISAALSEYHEVAIPVPQHQSSTTAVCFAAILALNDWIRTYAAERKFPYVDYYSALVDNEGGLRADLTPDGVHPNRKGYAVMAPIAQRGIDAALGTE